MTPEQHVDSLARAASAVAHEDDVSDLLLRLTQDATRWAAGDAGSLLVRPGPRRDLEMLAATDHTPGHLAVYQAQRAEGPCVEALASRRRLSVVGAAALTARWPRVGPAVVAAGFDACQAYPLVLRGHVLGVLGVLARRGAEPEPGAVRTVQALADLLAVVLAQPDTLSPDELGRRVDRVLAGRVVVERAKGALAELLEVDTATAYEALLERARVAGTTLTAAAERVLDEARRR